MEWIKFFGSIILAAGVGAIVALLTQPRIAEESTRRQELWRSKFLAYQEAIKLVNKHFAAVEWSGSNIPDGYIPTGQKPDRDSLNYCYAKLVLLCENKAIPNAFISCFGGIPSERPVTFNHRANLILLLRKDLKSTDIDLEADDIKYFLTP